MDKQSMLVGDGRQQPADTDYQPPEASSLIPASLTHGCVDPSAEIHEKGQQTQQDHRNHHGAADSPLSAPIWPAPLPPSGLSWGKGKRSKPPATTLMVAKKARSASNAGHMKPSMRSSLANHPLHPPQQLIKKEGKMDRQLSQQLSSPPVVCLFGASQFCVHPQCILNSSSSHVKMEVGHLPVGGRPPGPSSQLKSPVDVLPRAGLTNLPHQQLMPLIKQEEAMDDEPSQAGRPSNLPTSGASGASHFCLSPPSIIKALRDNWDRCDLDRPRSTTSVDPCDLSTPPEARQVWLKPNGEWLPRGCDIALLPAGQDGGHVRLPRQWRHRGTISPTEPETAPEVLHGCHIQETTMCLVQFIEDGGLEESEETTTVQLPHDPDTHALAPVAPLEDAHSYAGPTPFPPVHPQVETSVNAGLLAFTDFDRFSDFPAPHDQIHVLEEGDGVQVAWDVSDGPSRNIGWFDGEVLRVEETQFHVEYFVCGKRLKYWFDSRIFINMEGLHSIESLVQHTRRGAVRRRPQRWLTPQADQAWTLQKGAVVSVVQEGDRLEHHDAVVRECWFFPGGSRKATVRYLVSGEEELLPTELGLSMSSNVQSTTGSLPHSFRRFPIIGKKEEESID
ncbi:unnamed protein product [Vitrella brassicaformis CCMP3155]|uniref:Uncharacterized protein n=2 Tax=Vitrella brassicaformis TaxID=1169539 RepID=A0A0G4EUI4_VITBC|nr:unnamed protein product [Vitrella brassicaformis CCMP3155]|eukprot:CEM01960.1 unnamed protein product [Vitrella brassicaformis CCMP3155]